ncbi:MAG: energy-coupling factor transporter transmembrane protein EcfT [Streptococcaceae bacterium]|jgi:energy-coupling factor transport system permease protein|nr:energy-coupling factor transporter transmembrane protein EcfT [Streptococcaceae bacterium]
MARGFGYISRETPLHKLNGVTKLLLVLLMSVAVMVSYDTRFLIFIVIASLALFRVARIKFSDLRALFLFIAVFMLINTLLIFLFAPNQGTVVYGTKHIITHLFGGYDLTQEQLFYQLNVVLKYFAILPIALIFITTTEPSEFASSLNRIGVPYKAAYSVALTMRYIPDVQRDFREISQSQQARGIDISKNVHLAKRVKNVSSILMPLVFTSLDRIDVITNAMALRSFGKYKKRTWYRARPLAKADVVVIIIAFCLVGIAAGLIVVNGGRFYNPFK